MHTVQQQFIGLRLVMQMTGYRACAVGVCVCTCVRARACVRACVHAHVCLCFCVYPQDIKSQ